MIKINQEDMTVDVKEQTNSALKKDKKRRKIGYREVFDSTKQIKKIGGTDHQYAADHPPVYEADSRHEARMDLCPRLS